MRPGYYGVVVEAGALPHRAAQNYARRILDARGMMPPNQVVLRLRQTGSAESITEQLAPTENLDETLGIDEDNEAEALTDLDESTPPPMTPTKAPMAVPSGNPAPFAPLPPAGSYWPIVTRISQGRTVSYTANDGSTVGWAGRRWLADRSEGRRYHVGIDLFANFGDPVVAIENGEIVHFYPFCCGETKTTNALFVAHSNVVVNYGEVAPDSLRRTGLRVGSRVRAGQVIGYVGRNPGGSTMIHFEVYSPGTRRNAQWMKNAARPANVLNPTRYLLHLQEHGLVGTAGGTPVTPGTTPGTVIPATPGTGIDRSSPTYIQWVQSSLNQVNNAGLVVDGVSGSRTRQAVRDFQRSKGLTVDGIVGAQTEAALIAAGASPPPTAGGGTRPDPNANANADPHTVTPGTAAGG
ncbi:MAG: peptidoglycan DD-metalloendopeptidase family protein, partial [Leptolyngbyaceae cyanobacterium SM1_3_5]|nr:peptidoglycan DD-metalloendopeptidase family protein [Leptolyngbyaceae cyanobacterium SM1_3_5]